MARSCPSVEGPRDAVVLSELDEAHVRQLYRRAIRHVGAARKRFDATPEQRRELLERFLAATLGGDVQELERLLAEDVVAWADGGGKAPASRQPVVGRDSLLRYLVIMVEHPQWARVTSATVGTVNTEPAIVFELDGRLLAVMVPEFDGDRVTAFHAVTNPEKLAFLARQTI